MHYKRKIKLGDSELTKNFMNANEFPVKFDIKQGYYLVHIYNSGGIFPNFHLITSRGSGVHCFYCSSILISGSAIRVFKVYEVASQVLKDKQYASFVFS